MNRRLLIILLSAFVIAAISTYIVWRMVGARLNVAKPQATTSIVAAAKDLKIGMILAPADLTSIQLVGAVPQGAILDKKNAIGRGVVANIYNGEAILDSRLAPLGSGGGLAATIKPGMRATAIRVDEVVGVAGFVTPGMRVDVLVSGVPPNQSGAAQETQTKTILQNIEVLSAGQDIQKDAEGKPQSVQVVNLLVTPEQAQILALASNQMKIQLVLRNPLDTTTVTVPDTATTNLFGAQRAPQPKAVSTGGPRKPKAAAPPPFTITVLNGTSKSEEKFVTPGGQQ